jgi:hypothetical protein
MAGAGVDIVEDVEVDAFEFGGVEVRGPGIDDDRDVRCRLLRAKRSAIGQRCQDCGVIL